MSSEQDKQRYTESTLHRATIRWGKCKSAKEDNLFWNEVSKEYREYKAKGLL
jgi:hypothetical protein